jgi:hypothetical protein
VGGAKEGASRGASGGFRERIEMLSVHGAWRRLGRRRADVLSSISRLMGGLGRMWW